MEKITELQQMRFIAYYGETFHIATAAELAGLSVEQAQFIADLPGVRHAINSAIDKRIEQSNLGPNWVLSELLNLYEVDLSSVIARSPTTGDISYDFSALSSKAINALREITITPGEFGTSVKVKLPDKRKLITDIGKHKKVNAFQKESTDIPPIHIHFDRQDEDA